MFKPHLALGQVISEKEVHKIFECQTTIGIRMSKKNNLFVLMSGSAKKKVYHDKWEGDILYYIGTDIKADLDGNQTLIRGNGNNNAQLREVWYDTSESKKQIFLFIKKETDKCVYKGPVTLISEPYMDWRDSSKQSKVWVFPVKLCNQNEIENEVEFEHAVSKAFDLDLLELYKKAKGKAASMQPENVQKRYESKSYYYERNPDVSAYAKKRAFGICDLCRKEAPFKDKYGIPYLEAHHVEWLSRGGLDEIDNVVALCPNCHSKMHIIDESTDIDKLTSRVFTYHNMLKKMYHKKDVY